MWVLRLFWYTTQCHVIMCSIIRLYPARREFYPFWRYLVSWYLLKVICQFQYPVNRLSLELSILVTCEEVQDYCQRFLLNFSKGPRYLRSLEQSTEFQSCLPQLPGKLVIATEVFITICRLGLTWKKICSSRVINRRNIIPIQSMLQDIVR